MKDNKCCICNIVSGNGLLGDIDKPFIQSANYRAVASVGAFIEGWSLIIPKEHDVSLLEHYQRDEFLKFCIQVKSLVEQSYGRTIIFEHGANAFGSLAGCGINHAHLHVVPFKKSLRDSLKNDSFVWGEIEASELKNVVGDKDYLFYADDVGNSALTGIFTIMDQPISQYFRKVLASELGKSDSYDYREFPFIETSQRTYTTLTHQINDQ